MWTKLSRPSVLIASPGDVKYLRDVVIRVLDTLRKSARGDHCVGIYDRVVDEAQDGFDGWRPTQGQVPLPSDPRCRAVVCIFGEQIGTELPADFPNGPVKAFLQGQQEGPRLVHPLTASSLESGGFALTCTVFECLAALAANKVDKWPGDTERGAPPVLILIVGDDTVIEEPDPFDANWGGHRLLHGAAKRYRKPSARRAWEDGEYRPQLTQLRNFLWFLQRHGVRFRIVPDEAAVRNEVTCFLQQSLQLKPPDVDREPFKGLEVYCEDDAEVFYGRTGECAQAVAELKHLFDDPERPTTYGIFGGSGAGKSSFLRAGVIAQLVRTTSAGYYCGCVVKPVELLAKEAVTAPDHNIARQSSGALRSLLSLALKAVHQDTVFDEALNAFDRADRSIQPSTAVELLITALDQKGAQWALAVGFDQFEELLDQRLEPELGPLWAPVVRFIDVAARSGRIAVLYTMQANRMQLMADDPYLGPLFARGGSQTLAFPISSLGEIINKPFARIGVELEPDLATELARRIVAFAESTTSSSQGSLLPLVSLMLRRLRDAALSPIPSGARSGHDARRVTVENADAPDRRSAKMARLADRRKTAHRLLTLDACSDRLDVGESIARMAEEAFVEARSASGPDWSDETLGELLRPLVRVGGPNMDHLSLLRGVPKTRAARQLADALIKRRILVPEDGEHIRIVHEAALHHWPMAATWLTKERRLLALSAIIGYRAMEWHHRGRDLEEARGASMREVDEGAELLTLWHSVYNTSSSSGMDPADAVVRDYIFTLLLTHPEPDRVVEAAPNKPTHFHLAAAFGDLELVKAHLARSPSCVTLLRRDRKTAVFGPCVSGRRDILELLLEAGAKPDPIDEYGWTPLHIAAHYGHVECLEVLRGAGAQVDDARDMLAGPPLVLAASQRHEAAARWLVKHGAPVNAMSKAGWTALRAAAAAGAVSIVQLLVESGAAVDLRCGRAWAALHSAAYFNQVACVRALLDAKASVDLLARHDHWNWFSGMRIQPPHGVLATPLHIACDRGHLETVQLLLEHGANPEQDVFPHITGGDPDDASAGYTLSPDGWTLLHLAADRGQVEISQLLAGVCRDVDACSAKGVTPFRIALSRNHIKLAEKLRLAGADINRCQESDETFLQVAARAGAMAVIRYLLEVGADVGAPDQTQDPPLLLAAKHGHLEAVRLLLEHGGLLEQRDRAGRTVLHIAAERGDPGLVCLLVDFRAAIDARDEQGQTALHIAAVGSPKSRLEIVMLLLAEDTQQARARDKAGWTPLHCAAQAGHVELIEPLVRAGAVVDELSDAPPMTPLQAAAEVGRTEVVEALLDQHADPNVRTAVKDRAVLLACRNRHYSTVLRLLELVGMHDAATKAALCEQLEEHRRRRGKLRVPLEIPEMLVTKALQPYLSNPKVSVADGDQDDTECAANDARRWRVGSQLWEHRNEPWPLPPIHGTEWHVLEPADALEKLVPPGSTAGVIDSFDIDGLRSLADADGILEARLPSVGSMPRTALLVSTLGQLRLATQGLRLLSTQDSGVTSSRALLHLALFCATRSCGGDVPVLVQSGDQLRTHAELSHGFRSRAASLARPPRISAQRTRTTRSIEMWRHLLVSSSDVGQCSDDFRAWVIDGVIQFRDSLFACVFHVRSDGQVTLLDDRRMASGISARMYTFVEGQRSVRLVEGTTPPIFYDPPVPGGDDALAFRHAWQVMGEGPSPVNPVNPCS